MKRRLLIAVWAMAALVTQGLAPETGWAGKTGTITGKVESKKKKFRKNTVIYVEKADGKFKPPKKPVVMDQKDSKFKPKVLVVVKGTTVEYLNADPTEHSVYSPDGKKFDLGKWGLGKSKSHKYEDLGAFTQLCKLHPMMLAYVIVVQNPYYDKTNKKGEFKIKDVPPGKYTLRTWNERRKADAVEVEVKADEETTANIALHR